MDVTMIHINTQNKLSGKNRNRTKSYTRRERAPKWTSTKIAVPFNCLPLIVIMKEESQKGLLIKIYEQN
jgi:hypothetical protein